MVLLLLKLFYTFFKIGLFGFGGGYAMISMIQGEVVTRYEWLSSSDFTDIIAISQMTPGPIGINSATYVGYTAMVNDGYSHAAGILGSTVATFSVVLPSFILMIFISRFFLKYQRHPAVEAVFNGLRPGVVGLLAAAALVLMNGENFGTDTYQVVISILLFYRMFHCFQPIQSKSDSADCMQWCLRLLYILNQLYSSLSGKIDWGVGIEKSLSANKDAKARYLFQAKQFILIHTYIFIIHLSDMPA